MGRTLVDSSCWVHYLRRRGDGTVRERVSGLLERGDAVWCAAIRLELWNGVGSAADRKILRDFERLLPELPITDAVWDEACSLAERCRKAGKRRRQTTFSSQRALSITKSPWNTRTHILILSSRFDFLADEAQTPTSRRRRSA